MAPLSNFLKRSDPSHRAQSDHDEPVICRPARPDEVHPGVRMLLSSGGRAADSQQLLDFLNFARLRGMDLGQMWVARRDGALLWVMLPLPSPGRTMLLYLPHDPPAAGLAGVAGDVIDLACGFYAQRDIQLAQALLDPNDAISRQMLEARQFQRMAELLYLHADVRRAPAPGALASDFELLSYSADTHGLFASAILASYRDSLDCPRLNGVRDIEDVILGHKASGEFDPKHWFVLCQATETGRTPVGVLLLSRLPRGDSAELVYLGLSPEARRRKMAQWLMRKAFAVTQEMGSPRLSLAVDAANAPALKLYYRFGMSRIGVKLAMMRTLIGSGGVETPRKT